MQRLGSVLISYSLPIGLSLWGATLTPLCSLCIFGRQGMGFGDAFLTALMSATMAAAFFYYAGFKLLREFGLPSDTTMSEFHDFMRDRRGTLLLRRTLTLSKRRTFPLPAHRTEDPLLTRS